MNMFPMPTDPAEKLARLNDVTATLAGWSTLTADGLVPADATPATLLNLRTVPGPRQAFVRTVDGLTIEVSPVDAAYEIKHHLTPSTR